MLIIYKYRRCFYEFCVNIWRKKFWFLVMEFVFRLKLYLFFFSIVYKLEEEKVIRCSFIWVCLNIMF